MRIKTELCTHQECAGGGVDLISGVVGGEEEMVGLAFVLLGLAGAIVFDRVL